jgi:hypothetical protein
MMGRMNDRGTHATVAAGPGGDEPPCDRDAGDRCDRQAIRLPSPGQAMRWARKHRAAARSAPPAPGRRMEPPRLVGQADEPTPIREKRRAHRIAAAAAPGPARPAGGRSGASAVRCRPRRTLAPASVAGSRVEPRCRSMPPDRAGDRARGGPAGDGGPPARPTDRPRRRARGGVPRRLAGRGRPPGCEWTHDGVAARPGDAGSTLPGSGPRHPRDRISAARDRLSAAAWPRIGDDPRTWSTRDPGAGRGAGRGRSRGPPRQRSTWAAIAGG